MHLFAEINISLLRQPLTNAEGDLRGRPVRGKKSKLGLVPHQNREIPQLSSKCCTLRESGEQIAISP
jgi:hypothetical protein